MFSPSNSQVHTLHTSVPQDYADGQRVFVGGILNSKQIVLPENKRRNQPIIKAFQIYALDSIANDETKLKDLNSVELLTSICSDVLDKDDHSVFQVVTHVQNTRTQEIRANFHSVFVYDQDLSTFVRNNLEKGDRVYLTGSFKIYNHMDGDGKLRQTGSIHAETIDKVKKFNRNQLSEQEPALAE